MAKKKHKVSDNTIAQNKKARFDYHIDEKFEAGLVLLGWEVVMFGLVTLARFSTI